MRRGPLRGELRGPLCAAAAACQEHECHESREGRATHSQIVHDRRNLAPVKRRRLGLASGLAAVAVALGVLPAHGADGTPSTPNGRDEAVQDGCQRNPVGLLTYTSPEWVFIRYGKRDASGAGADNIYEFDGDVVEDTEHPAPGGGDLPEGHEWYDFNADLVSTNPDQAYLTGAGSATIRTERESGQIPTSAWTTAGDHEAVWGS